MGCPPMAPYVQSCNVPGPILSQHSLAESGTERRGPQNCATCVLQAACLDNMSQEGFDTCLATGSSCGRRRCRASSMWRRMSLCDSCNSMFGTAIARRILCFSSRKGVSVRDDPQDVHVSRETIRKGRDGRSLGDRHHDLEHDGDLASCTRQRSRRHTRAHVRHEAVEEVACTSSAQRRCQFEAVAAATCALIRPDDRIPSGTFGGRTQEADIAATSNWQLRESLRV